MSFAGWIQVHRRSMLFLMAILALGGLLSSFGLPVSLFPQVNFPRIEVSLDAGDRPAERMAVEVTYPVEEAIRAVPGRATCPFHHQPGQRRHLDIFRLGPGHDRRHAPGGVGHQPGHAQPAAGDGL